MQITEADISLTDEARSIWNELQDVAGMAREGHIGSERRQSLVALEDRFISLLHRQTSEAAITSLFEIAISCKSQRVVEAFPLAANRTSRLGPKGWHSISRTTDADYLYALITRGADPARGIGSIARSAIASNHRGLQEFLITWDGDASSVLKGILDSDDLLFAAPEFCARYIPKLIAENPETASKLVRNLVRSYRTADLVVVILGGADVGPHAEAAEPSVFRANLRDLSSAHGRLGLVAQVGSLEDVLREPSRLDRLNSYLQSTAEK
jgi:hypothetical protein